MLNVAYNITALTVYSAGCLSCHWLGGKRIQQKVAKAAKKLQDVKDGFCSLLSLCDLGVFLLVVEQVSATQPDQSGA